VERNMPPPIFKKQKSLLTIFDNQKGKIWENIFVKKVFKKGVS
jgi:hypothetical protein